LSTVWEAAFVTKRAPTNGGGAKDRALSQHDGIPDKDFEEITDRIEILTMRPQSPDTKISNDDLGKILSSFEADLLKLNKALSKETRANRTTLKDFSEECKKTTEAAAGLNTELALVTQRGKTG